MADESIWNLIGPKKKFCSFKMQTETEYLCKNENNVSGLCDFFSCPLANNTYATVREIEGRLYLFRKVPERVNTPAKTYEKILLDPCYEKALAEIEQNLTYFDPVLIHKCKQKLGKLTQYLIRKYEIDINENKIKYVARRKKIIKLERGRSQKILNRMDIESEIKQELALRLEEGLFGEELKEKVENEKEKMKVAKRRRIFIAEFEESDDYCNDEKVKEKKKEKIKLKW
ncbi:RNA-binding nuclear protein (MAK16) containing a distinct C4 Zn-finger [Pseudoloma neurophilia]|uniref:Protein MAK16 n=1 Tax=Pseudoloma neurophilia TaxID=146866 RepID=A0A0R0M8H4_9MICR|nr:RNA-binding nuclear protein (MAK16) containing a distinct C4 Zn-finger [Pseudoloma neurophilia]